MLYKTNLNFNLWDAAYFYSAFSARTLLQARSKFEPKAGTWQCFQKWIFYRQIDYELPGLDNLSV